MMMPYSAYKDSKLDWLGKIPFHWDLVKLGACFKERNEKVSDKDFAALSVTKNGILPQMEHVAKTDAGDNRKKVCIGDFVINSRSDRKGSSGTSDYDGSVSLISIILEPRLYDPRFAHHLLRSYNFQEEFYKYGKGIVADLWSTRYSDMKNIFVPLMPIAEQKAIATFLDRETQRIDSLIEEKQNFIKLLKEKRQALISHVVTKGLNPNVEMQDSGIEWIGQVPKHWNITSLKSVSTVVDPNPSHRNPEYVDNGFPFISTKEFTGIDGIELDTLRRVSEDTVIEQEKRCEFREGSIAFSRKGTIGEVRILPHHIRFALLDSVCVINAGETVSYQYLYLQAKSSVYDSQLGAVVRGAALKQVSVGKVRDLLTLCPPIDEQNQIVTYIDQQLEKLDKLVVETSTSLSLLKERRISLISAAVTGKIDVREAV